MEDVSLKFKVYHKNTHTDYYLQFTSHQPLKHKLGVIQTLTHRVEVLVTVEKDKEEDRPHLRKVPSASCYNKWVWDIQDSKKKTPHPCTYVKGAMEAITHLPT